MPSGTRVTLLFFGPLRDVVGAKQIHLEIESPIVSDVVANLQRQYPRLENSRLLVAVNEEYATGETVLNDGDEIAVFTPVSGG